ncbi:hypothetical protein PoB_006687100 [Plakobranchus ocellatus]|uniref:Uncharacterized protein n=1 Tax=Plakobranchus ocellatus TaxID=259542 RepID=A0AAV4D8V5_9GAST|nr:hypothetical protein PoB_006687100 [Plakobranchus ocellatus]
MSTMRKIRKKKPRMMARKRTAPTTYTSSLSVLEAATYDFINATIMDEPLSPTSSTPVSAIDNLRNASEYNRKKINMYLVFKSILIDYHLEQFSSQRGPV